MPLFAVDDPIYEAGDKLQVAETARTHWRICGSGKEQARRVEASQLQSRRSGRRRQASRAGPDDVLTGEQASEARIKGGPAAERMAKARYVHFATHGILGVDKGKQPALVLNLVGNKNEDGFLELDEITNLKLNADLVVLSACRTELSKMATAKASATWPAPFCTPAARAWCAACGRWTTTKRRTSQMVDFHGQLQKGRPAAEALPRIPSWR